MRLTLAFLALLVLALPAAAPAQDVPCPIPILCPPEDPDDPEPGDPEPLPPPPPAPGPEQPPAKPVPPTLPPGYDLALDKPPAEPVATGKLKGRRGGPGPDRMRGRVRAERFRAKGGQDLLHANDRSRNRLVDCGEGNDTAVLDPKHRRGGHSDFTMLWNGRVRGCETVLYQDAPKADPAKGITWIARHRGGIRKRGTAKNDTLLGSHGPDRISGRGGADIIWGDHLHNDRSSALDRLNGDSGSDVIYGGPGRNVIYGGDQDDFLQGGVGRNEIHGGHGDDTLRVRGGGGNSVDGGPGDDRIQAYSRGRNRIHCGPGRDTVELDRNDRAAKDCERLILH